MSSPEPRPRPWLVAGLLIAAAVPLAWYCVTELRVTTAITHYLPRGDQQLLAQVSQRMTESPWSRTILISLRGADASALHEASRAIGAELRASPSFAHVHDGTSADTGRAVYDLYFPRRAYLWSEDPQQDAQRRLSPEGLASAAQALRVELGKPTGVLARQLAVDDPLQVFAARLARLEAFRGTNLMTRDGMLTTSDGKAAIVLATTHASAFDTTAQSVAFTTIERAFEAQRARVASLRLGVSGLGRFAIHAEKHLRSDATWISTISTVAVFVLFLIVFGSLRSIALGMLPIATGMLVATAFCIAWFREVHGITLAIGATAIGVCEDYPVHLLNHHALLGPGQSAFRSTRGLRTGLVIGAVTTAAGFSGLGWTSLPGVRELAAFSAIGVIVALLTTLYVLPHFMPDSGKATRFQRRAATYVGAIVRTLVNRPAVAIGLVMTAGACIALGAGRIEFTDRVDRLLPAPAELLGTDSTVRDLVGAFDQGRFVIAVGDSIEGALQSNDSVAVALDAAVAAGELAAFRSLHDLLPSRSLQERNVAALAAQHDPTARLAAAFDQAGFDGAAFRASRFFERPNAPPLDWTALQASPLRDLTASLVIDLEHGHAVVTLLRGVSDLAAIEQRLRSTPGAHLFDQRSFVSALYRVYRERTLQLLAVGLGVILLIVLARHRKLRPTLGCVFPPFLAAGTALCVLALGGQELNLLHVVGTSLVVSLGVDYSVFLMEAAHDEHDLEAAALSTAVGALTTALSFGLLAWSSVPALRGLGEVVGLGTMLALLLAPTGLLLVKPRARSET